MQYISRIEKWIRYILAVLLCLILISFWMMSNIYAKYSTQASGSDDARVAKFDITEAILNNGSEANETLSFDLAPGEEKIYTVQVTNKSEVAVEYSITAESQYNNLPLKTEMLDKNQKVIEKDYLSANGKSPSTYYIKVSWPKGNDTQSENYMERTDLLTITLKAAQIN